MTITFPNGSTYDIIPSDDSYRYRELMGEDSVHLRWEDAEYTEIPVGSSVTFRGVTYYIERPQDVVIQHRRLFDYDAVFETYAARLRYTPYINPDDGRVSFHVTGTMEDHLKLLKRSADMYAGVGTWTAVYETTEQKTIGYEKITLYDAVSLIAQEFECEYDISSLTVTVCKKYQPNGTTAYPLSYGYGNGLLPGIWRTNHLGGPRVSALVVEGGDRNINTSSNQNAYGAKTLHMPAGVNISGDATSPVKLRIGYDGTNYAYIASYNASTHEYTYTYNVQFDYAKAVFYEADMDGRILRTIGRDKDGTAIPAGHGTAMEVYGNKDIYPHKVHTVQSVSYSQVTKEGETFNQYSVTVNDGIDYNAYAIPGKSLHMIFQDGELAGKEFACVYVHSAGKFMIESTFIDDERMPGGSFVPAQGDKFIVINCMIPQDYIRKDSEHSGAEWDLCREAVKYLYSFRDFQYIYSFAVDRVYAEGVSNQNLPKISTVGAYIALSDTDVQQTVNVRITAVRQEINDYRTVELTVSETAIRGGKRRRELAAKSEAYYTETESHHAQSTLDETSRRQSKYIDTLPTQTQVSAAVASGTAQMRSAMAGDSYSAGTEVLDDHWNDASGADVRKCIYIKVSEADIEKDELKLLLMNGNEGIETEVVICNDLGSTIGLVFGTDEGHTIIDMSSTAELEDGMMMIIRYTVMGEWTVVETKTSFIQ